MFSSTIRFVSPDSSSAQKGAKTLATTMPSRQPIVNRRKRLNKKKNKKYASTMKLNRKYRESVDKLRRRSMQEIELTKSLLADSDSNNLIEARLKELESKLSLLPSSTSEIPATARDASRQNSEVKPESFTLKEEIIDLRARARYVQEQIESMASESDNITLLVSKLAKCTETTIKASVDSQLKIKEYKKKIDILKQQIQDKEAQIHSEQNKIGNIQTETCVNIMDQLTVTEKKYQTVQKTNHRLQKDIELLKKYLKEQQALPPSVQSKTKSFNTGNNNTRVSMRHRKHRTNNSQRQAISSHLSRNPRGIIMNNRSSSKSSDTLEEKSDCLKGSRAVSEGEGLVSSRDIGESTVSIIRSYSASISSDDDGDHSFSDALNTNEVFMGKHSTSAGTKNDEKADSSKNIIFENSTGGNDDNRNSNNHSLGSSRRTKTATKNTASNLLSNVPPEEERVDFRRSNDILGRGAFGNVYVGYLLKTSAQVAVKELRLDGVDIDSEEMQMKLKNLESEINVMRPLKHSNIVSYVGTSRQDGNLHIIMEFMAGGSIAKLLQRFGALPEENVRQYLRQILNGLAYLHANKVIHRDIKGANILVKDATVKLADFGCSLQFSGEASIEDGVTQMIQGSVPWMAPEVIRQQSPGRKSDIWSVGCLVIEMLTGKRPWPSKTKQTQLMYVIATQKKPPPIPAGIKESLSTKCISFLNICFQPKPVDRWSASELLSHPFLHEVQK